MTILFLILGLGLGAYSVYLFSYTLLKSGANEDALAAAAGFSQKKSSSGILNFSKPLIKALTLGMALKLQTAEKRASLEKLIKTAGLDDELTPDEFIGMQLLWGVLFPILLLIFNFAFKMGLSPAICVGLGLAGYFFPNSHCSAKKKLRNSAISREFPFFIDLLALSVEAGMDFIGAIDRISSKLPEKSVLRQELEILIKDTKLGASRKEALIGLSERVDLDVMLSFCATIIDATETGVSVAGILKDQSEQMRSIRFSEAEKKGAKASQIILLPMVLFILPAIFLVIFTPMILSFVYNGVGG